LARTSDAGVRVGITDAENVLVSVLGRGFIDPSRMDAKNHWQHGYSNDRATLQVDYTMTDSGDGKTVTVNEHSRFQAHTQRVSEVLEK
jgi:hypothetical protein